jgi:acetylornithine deacetylase
MSDLPQGAAPSATTLDLLERLVSFDTESSKSNLALVAFVIDYLTKLGAEYIVAPNAAGDKAAVYVNVGPRVDGGVVLSGHTDVVPVAGQPWTGDPFKLRRDGRRLIGRGACDMKGFDAVCLAMLPDLMRLPLKQPVHLLLSYDEETTCLGVMDVIARMGVDLPRPRAVIVGEPTLMQVADAHKSVGAFFTTITGFEVHSSSPHLGVNAIYGGTAVVEELQRIFDEMVARGDPTGRFSPGYTTVSVGTIKGGTARNITARECVVYWEFRGVPGLPEREIPDRIDRYCREFVIPRLQVNGGKASIRTETEIYVPGLAPDPGSAAETLALRLTNSNQTITVPYGTEAGRFQQAGIATVVCGPGDIAQAHQPDEWIDESQLAACEAFVRRLGQNLC